MRGLCVTDQFDELLLARAREASPFDESSRGAQPQRPRVEGRDRHPVLLTAKLANGELDDLGHERPSDTLADPRRIKSHAYIADAGLRVLSGDPALRPEADVSHEGVALLDGEVAVAVLAPRQENVYGVLPPVVEIQRWFVPPPGNVRSFVNRE